MGKNGIGVSTHPLRGKPIRLVLFGGEEIDAFVAEIDASRGITIHALDNEEYGKLPDGEVFCLNFIDECDKGKAYSHYKLSYTTRFDIVREALEKGFFDCGEYENEQSSSDPSMTGSAPCVFSR